MVLRAACMALAFAPCQLVAQPVQENTMKAAFIYNFVLFTEWPDDPFQGANSINICVNPASEMQDALLVLNGKSAKSQRLKVLQKNAFDKDVTQCHVMYFEHLDQLNWPAIKKAIANNKILTITDDAEIGRSGAMITLTLSEGKMVFDIDHSAARQSRLTFSSKLLRLARMVR